jgi:hypothetical protein
MLCAPARSFRGSSAMTVLISRRLALVSGALSLASLATARWRGDVGRSPPCGSMWAHCARRDRRNSRTWSRRCCHNLQRRFRGSGRRAAGERWSRKSTSCNSASLATEALQTGGARNTRTDTIDGELSFLDAAGQRIAQAHLFTTRPSPSITATAPSETSAASACPRSARFSPIGPPARGSDLRPTAAA